MRVKRSTAVLDNTIDKQTFARHLKRMRGVSAAIGKLSLGKTSVSPRRRTGGET
jgi:hypothetical protein